MKTFLRSKIYFAASLLYFLVFVPGLQARTMIITNFDDVQPVPFSFKDEGGTLFRVGVEDGGADRKNVLRIEFNVAKSGWAGWGIALAGRNAQDYGNLTFLIKADSGGDKVEVGLKDQNGSEKKLRISQYADLGKNWKKVKIPLKDFAGVNLASLENFTFGFPDGAGSGKIYADDIQFESVEAAEMERSAGGSYSNKVVVDGFERANPTDIYLIFEGDDSSLRLNASRIVKEGDYAMELEYTLSSLRPWGSWVSAEWHAKEVALDWRGAQEVKLWVKGDGSGNIFQFVITDSDGEKWKYEDREILKSTRWELLTMPISEFVLMDKRKNQTFDLDEIRSYAIIIKSMESKSTTGAKTSVGKILVDQLYLSGEQISSIWAVPPRIIETEKVRVLRFGNIDFNGQLFTEFFYTPEEKSKASHFGKLISNGKVGNYSARIEIASQSQEFGDAARFSVEQSTAGGSTAVTQNVNEIQVSLQGFANNVSPYLTQVTVGNLFVDYSPFTFSPVFGFKGLSAEGDVDIFNYHVFILKHKLDSFTLGSRGKLFWLGSRITGTSVYYREVARVANGGTVSGTGIQQTTEFNPEEVQNDFVYTVDAERPFWDEKILVGGTYGYNRFNLYAAVDRSNPFDPVYSNRLEPPTRVEGEMVRGHLLLSDILIPGFKIDYRYRIVDTQFKPRYRQNPVGFDDVESDQKGHTVRFDESWKGFIASLQYDTINRISNSDYFRHQFNWGFGYYGFDKMDLAFTQDVRRELYKFTSNRTNVTYDKDEKVTTSEIYIRIQLSSRAAFFIRPRRTDVVQTGAGGRTYADESLYGKMEFYANSNLKIFGEFRTTHYAFKDFEPKGPPFDDNFIRLSAEFNF